MKDRLITEYSSPEEIINTNRGDINFKDWCNKEAKRIGDAKVVTREDGYIALIKE